MSFSSGTFSINSTGQPVVSGTVISSTAFNALTADLATGLSTCVLKDGTQTTTALVPFAFSLSTASFLRFPATQAASAGANDLDDYEEGSFTGTLTGCTTAPTITVKYTKIGRLVNIEFPSAGTLTGTSDATSKTLTGMPAGIRPAQQVDGVCRSSDNGGATVLSLNQLGTDGVLTMFPTVAGGNWTASGTALIIPQNMTYSV